MVISVSLCLILLLLVVILGLEFISFSNYYQDPSMKLCEVRIGATNRSSLVFFVESAWAALSMLVRSMFSFDKQVLFYRMMLGSQYSSIMKI